MYPFLRTPLLPVLTYVSPCILGIGGRCWPPAERASSPAIRIERVLLVCVLLLGPLILRFLA